MCTKRGYPAATTPAKDALNARSCPPGFPVHKTRIESLRGD